MSRRALDLLFASGAAAIAVLMVVLGFVLADQASFAEDYVKEQLGEQKITFTPAENLSEEEAYNFLRKQAMEKRVTIGAVAAAVIDSHELLS